MFNLSRDLTSLPHRDSMQIYGCKVLVFCHYADRFRDHKHCDGGNIILVCQVTSSEHVKKVM